MRTRYWIFAAAYLILVARIATAQDSKPAPEHNPSEQKTQAQAAPAQPAPSLADVARKAREQKKAETTPAHVFTNDNLPGPGSAVNVVGTESAPSPAGPPSSAPSGSDEKMWRDRFATARAKLKRDQDDLDVSQRELGKLSVQYYPNDPQNQLMQSFTNSDINNKRAQIAQKEQIVKQDEAAIADLEDQLRKSGGDPGWAR